MSGYFPESPKQVFVLVPARKNKKEQTKKLKGRQLAILYVITTSGPLAEKKEGEYVSDLKWTKHTPHATMELTYETLWMAKSNKGDYHNNMTPKMFLQWVKKELFPEFKKLYSG